MRHPLENIQNRSRTILFLVLLSLTIATMLVMNGAGSSLNTEEAPYGILSLELAGSQQRAKAILDSWDQAAQMRAAFIQGLDFLFLVLYSTTIGLACLWAGETLKRVGWSPSALGIPLAWGLWLAAFCDALENVALVVMLFGSITSPWPEIAVVCAVIKFVLIFLGLVYALYALVIRFASTVKSPATNAS
jgi:small-conductance mechanosensitive channel